MRVVFIKLARSWMDWLRWNIPQPLRVLSLEDDKRLFRVAKELASAHITQNKKILFIPSYYQMKFSRMFDITLAFALQARGAFITPIFTDGLFVEEDVIFGGIYNNYRINKKAWYSKLERKIWIDLLKTKPLFLRDYISTADISKAYKLVEKITIHNYSSFSFAGYDVGYRAGIATCNLNNMTVLDDNPRILHQLKAHSVNILLLLISYKKMFKKIKPNIIYSEFPHYYQWHVPFYVAQKEKIYFSSSVTTEKKNSWFFSSNTDSFQDATTAWDSFKISEDCKNEFANVTKAIKQRISRSVSYSPVFPKEQSDELLNQLKAFTSQKPTVFLPVNVLFDLAVFKKSPMFDHILDMLDWAIKYFNQHPEYNLIIKAHPAEKLFYESHLKQADRYCLANWLKANHYSLSDNIKLLDYDSPISSFDILPLISLGLVYTSTTSIEMAWFGIPVISTSYNHYNNKGFVTSPRSKQALAKLIGKLLSNKESEKTKLARIETSKKYYLLYYYHTFINLGLIQGSDTGRVKDTFLYNSIQDLLPTANKPLEYICSTILARKPAFGVDRWPPFTEPI